MVHGVNSKKLRNWKEKKTNKRLSQHSRPEVKRTELEMMAKKMKLKNPRNIP